MTDSTYYRTSLYLRDRATLARAKDAAEAAGSIASRGDGVAAGRGSLAKLVQDIADGAVLPLRATLVAEAVAVLVAAYEQTLPHEPGHAEVLAALRLLGHAPAGEDA